jgi:hypothetical protein
VKAVKVAMLQILHLYLLQEDQISLLQQNSSIVKEKSPQST